MKTLKVLEEVDGMMKKIIRPGLLFLVLGFFLSASYSLAGNIGNVDQTGNDNEAFIDQTGDGHHAEIVQDGDNNGGFGGPGSSSASIVQINSGAIDPGCVNNPLQDGCEGGGDPAEGNDGYIEQTGNSNNADIFQEGNGNGGMGGNTETAASIVQTGNFNTGAITQIGNHNSADIAQTGDDNTASIFQEGDDNIAKILETGSDNFGDVLQLGQHNESMVLQTGDLNTAFASQMGNFNGAFVTQEGIGHWGDVMQTGDLNSATVTQVPGP